MKHLLLILLLLTGIAAGSKAQQAAPAATGVHNFSLQDCINYAYEHQDTVKNAGLDIKSAEYKVKETTGIGLPQISASANFQDYLKTPTVIFGGNKFSIYQPYNATFGATLTQILFDGSYLVGLKASKTYKELSQRNYTRSKIDARVNVTKAYYQILVSNERLKLLDSDLGQLKHQVDQTVAQNKQGFVEQVDVQRIQVQYNNLLTTRENTDRLLAINYQMLKFQMGMPIAEDINLTDKLEDVHFDNTVTDGGDTSFYHNRIEYNLQETNVKLNELDLKNKKSKFLPTLNLTGNTALGYQSATVGKLFNTQYPSTYIGVNLSVPIFSGGQKANQVKQSKITVEKSQNDLENLKNGMLLQANAARITYVNSLRSLDNQKENQKLAQEVLRVSKIKYQQGVGSSIEVTQAQTDLEDADNKYIQSLYDALVSKVDLDKAYGKIQ
ncbi:MAG TPA: TolC family protein [Mucilaginibacter sp.]|nr:TolC family protein [Mucilaginibacter sp.]